MVYDVDLELKVPLALNIFYVPYSFCKGNTWLVCMGRGGIYNNYMIGHLQLSTNC